MDATITKVPVISLTKGSQHYEISPFVEGSTGIASGTLNLQTGIVTEELDFGNLTASELSLEIYNIYFDLQGFNIQLILEDSTTHDRTTLFTGIVDSSKEDTFGVSRQVVAYDWAYYHRSDNVASWWNDFWHGVNNRANATLKEIRDSLMVYMGFSASTDTYLNDSIVIPNNFELATTLDFETALKFVCELQATFPHIDANGNMEFISLSSTSTDIRGTYEGSNSSWEDYTTDAITGIGIYSTSDDLAQVVGTDANVYNIAGNLLALTLDASTITTMCNNILQALATVQFVPCEINMIMSDFDLSLGQKIETEKGYSYVMQNVYHGICMVDEMISCKALGKKLSQDVASYNNTMMNGAKVSKIEKDIDGITTTVSAAVVEAHEAAEDAEEALEQVGQYDTRITTVESSITQHANEIVMKVDSNGRIVQAALTTDPDEGTEFKVSADNIEFIANGVMQLSANNIGISATNFTLDTDGNVDIKGDLTADDTFKMRTHNTDIPFTDHTFEAITTHTGISGAGFDSEGHSWSWDDIPGLVIKGPDFNNSGTGTTKIFEYLPCNDPIKVVDGTPYDYYTNISCYKGIQFDYGDGSNGRLYVGPDGMSMNTTSCPPLSGGPSYLLAYNPYTSSATSGSMARATATTTATANAVVVRNASGHIFTKYYNTTCSAENIASYTSSVAFIDSNGYLRKTSLAQFKAWFGASTYASLNYLGYTSSSTAKNFTIGANTTEIVIVGSFTGDNITKLFSGVIPKNLIGSTAKEVWLSAGSGGTTASQVRCLCNVTLVNSTTIQVKGTAANNGSTNVLSATSYYVYHR